MTQYFRAGAKSWFVVRECEIEYVCECRCLERLRGDPPQCGGVGLWEGGRGDKEEGRGEAPQGRPKLSVTSGPYHQKARLGYRKNYVKVLMRRVPRSAVSLRLSGLVLGPQCYRRGYDATPTAPSATRKRAQLPPRTVASPRG